MAVALVQEFKTVGNDRTTTNYDHIVGTLDLDSNPPLGLIAHTAGWDEKAGVFRIVGIWTSADTLESFRRDRLAPAVAEGPVKPAEREEPDLESIYAWSKYAGKAISARFTTSSRFAPESHHSAAILPGPAFLGSIAARSSRPDGRGV